MKDRTGRDTARVVKEAGALFDAASRLLEGQALESAATCRGALERACDPGATVLVAGVRSTGKSSFVSSLWGDSELLPTAVRDCTQTNTLVRAPRGDERDRRLFLNYLARDDAEEFASRGLAFHRLRQVVAETLGPFGPKFDEGTPGARVRLAIETVRRLFAERHDVYVLHEPATEQLEQLEQFVACLDSPDYVPGGRVEKDWTGRREYLMGRRGSDGRTLAVGKLLSLRLVELVPATDRWAESPPTLIDTPWIPAFHNVRRADLVIRESECSDVIVVTALPEPFEPEPWLREVFQKRPGLRGRTLVVFNQVDTVDTSRLFGRGGFAEAWAGNVERLGREGIRPENLYISCARLPFLEGLRARDVRDPLGAEREGRLRAVLGKIRALASARGPAGLFKERLLAACDPADCGVESVRSRLVELMANEVRSDRTRQACEAVVSLGEPELAPGRAGCWLEVRSRAAALLRQLPRATREEADERKLWPTLSDGSPLFKG